MCEYSAGSVLGVRDQGTRRRNTEMRFCRKTAEMRAVQGAPSIPQGAYLAYVTKEHAGATPKCEVYMPF